MSTLFWIVYYLGWLITTWKLLFFTDWWHKPGESLLDLTIDTFCAAAFWPCVVATWLYKWVADHWLPGEDWY